MSSPNENNYAYKYGFNEKFSETEYVAIVSWTKLRNLFHSDRPKLVHFFRKFCFYHKLVLCKFLLQAQPLLKSFLLSSNSVPK